MAATVPTAEDDGTSNDGPATPSSTAGTANPTSGGWAALADRLRTAAHDAIDNLHDRLVYTTQGNKSELQKAAADTPNEDEDPNATSKKDTRGGFQSANQ